MKQTKYDIACTSGLVMMLIGLILHIVAIVREFGVWGFFFRPSISETKILFSNQTDLVVPGFILAIVGFAIVTYITTFKE